MESVLGPSAREWVGETRGRRGVLTLKLWPCSGLALWIVRVAKNNDETF